MVCSTICPRSLSINSIYLSKQIIQLNIPLKTVLSTLHEIMRDNKQFSEDGDEDKSSSLYCWWRSCATSEELRNMKVTSLWDVAELTPRLKVMREMERLALVASEGLDDLRCRLLAYRAGDLWVP